MLAAPSADREEHWQKVTTRFRQQILVPWWTIGIAVFFQQTFVGESGKAFGEDGRSDAQALAEIVETGQPSVRIAHDEHAPSISHKGEAPSDEAWLVQRIFHVTIVLVLTNYLFDSYMRFMKTATAEIKRMNDGRRGIALVTGASSGIGLATAKALSRDGYRVFGTSRKPVAGAADGITMLICDVTDEASVQSVVEEVLSEAGRIDLLVNNAGIGLLGGAEESTTAQTRALFDVNVFGTMRMTSAVLPVMREQRRGRIVNLSSILGLIPAPYNALYAATKHAIEGYSESLDHEVRTQGIRIVLVEPGVTRTSFEENLTRPDRPLSIYDKIRMDAENLMRELVAKGDEPEVVAKAVVLAANVTAPKRRYTAGKAAGQVRFMRRFMPEAFVDKSLRKFNKLPG